MQLMKRLKARVVKGRLVLDEPTDLPEGSEVELTAVDDYEWVEQLADVEDPKGLRDSLRESDRQFARGESISADDFLRKLDKQ